MDRSFALDLPHHNIKNPYQISLFYELMVFHDTNSCSGFISYQTLHFFKGSSSPGELFGHFFNIYDHSFYIETFL